MADIPGLRGRISARIFGGPSGQVFRGMVTLALGSGIGRIIGIASIPLLTRLYSPGDFGVLGVFTALVAILAPLVTLRYALALPLPRHDGVAINLLALSAVLMLVLTGLLTWALWLWGASLLKLVSMQVIAPWWWLIMLGVFGTAAYELLTMWATRRRAYKLIAQTNVTQSAAGALVKIGLGLAALQPIGLMIGQVVAQTGGVGRLISGFWSELQANRRHLSASRMRKAASRYRGFPVWRVPSQFLMVLSVQAPMLLMAGLYDVETTGQFGLAMMTLSVPVSFLGQTTARAFYAEAASLGSHRAPEIKTMFRSVLLRLGMLAAPSALVLLVLGPELFLFLFSSTWEMAGRFAQGLSIYLLFQFIQTPVAHVFYLFDGQRQLLWLNVQRVALLFGLFWSSRQFEWNPVQMIWIYAGVISVHYIMSTAYAYRFISRK